MNSGSFLTKVRKVARCWRVQTATAGRTPVSRQAVSRVVVHTTGRIRVGLGSRTRAAGFESIRPWRAASDRALRSVARIRSSVADATSRPDRVRPDEMIRNAACTCAVRSDARRM